MENPIFASEETSSAFTPSTGFNIAAAFPVTDEIARKMAQARWQRRFEWVNSSPATFLCIAAGLVGVALGSRFFR